MQKATTARFEAATAAISSPLLENISIDGATGIIINVTGGPDLSLYEVNEASTLITEAAHEDAEIIFGAVIDEEMGDEVRVTVIATGFGLDPAMQQATQSQQTMAALAHQMRSSQAITTMGAGSYAPQAPISAQPGFQASYVPQAPPPYIPPIPQQQQASPHPTIQQPMYQAQPQFQAAPQQPAYHESVYHEPAYHEAAHNGSGADVLHQPMQQPMNQQAAMEPQFAQPSAYDLNLNGSVQAELENAEKPLPRDVLLAKARQYRETQTVRQRQPQPEQLSMDVPEGQNSLEMARRLANEIVKSPFDTKKSRRAGFPSPQTAIDFGSPG